MMLARLTSIPVPYIVSAAAIVAALVLAVAHEMSPSPTHTAPPIAMSVQPEQSPVVPKSDDPPDWPHVVRVIPIVQAASPVAAPVVITAPTPIIPQNIPRHRISPAKPPTPGDICARHGGHRVDDAARRSWHCTFPKRERR